MTESIPRRKTEHMEKHLSALTESRRSQDSDEDPTKAMGSSSVIAGEFPDGDSNVPTTSSESKIPSRVYCVPCDKSEAEPEQSKPSRPWLNGYMRFGPLTGIFAMLCAVVSLVASLGVLVGSDGAPTSSWPAEPSIYIALFTAIANLSVRYACVHGVVITWWTRAIRGSTIARLHRDWSTGSTLHGALTAGPRMGLLGLACIFSTIVVIDGPLLQRATSVKPALVDINHTLNITIAPELPNSWSGVWSYWKGPMYWMDSFNQTAPTARRKHPTSTKIITGYFNGLADRLWSDTWWARNPIGSEFIQGCAHSCEATIRAPALAATSCRESMIPFHPTAQNDSYFLNSGRAPPLTADLFVIDLEFIPASDERPEKIDLITAFRPREEHYPTCGGFLNMTVCTLESAIGEYNITISEHTVTLGKPYIIALANNTRGPRVWNDIAQGWNSTLAGIDTMAFNYWFAGIAMATGHDGTLKISDRGAGQDKQYVQWHKQTTSNLPCSGYRDPHEDVMQSLNELMFLTGVQAPKYVGKEYLESHMDPGLSIHQEVIGYPHGDRNVFHSDYWWFAAAAVIEVICIAFVAPTYWGYWRLGRPLSLSPLETAKAFDSPILADCNSNSSARDISQTAGDTYLQYGVVRSGGATRLAFASPQFMERPRRGSTYVV